MTKSPLSRRRFIGASLTGGAAGALGVGAVACGQEGAQGAVASARYLSFHGAHQTGITTPAPTSGLMASFNVVATSREQLRDTFRVLSREIRRLMGGERYEERGAAYPPLHTGAVGNPAPPAELSVIVAVGASLFDERFGLADRRPRELVKMPFLANDRLDPTRTHGDLLLSISSESEEIDLFALRQIMRATRGALVLHWMLDGYNRNADVDPGPNRARARNLMGFLDGTANLRGADRAQMDRHVWVQKGDGEPAWAVGGTYQAVRVIRMLVEFWDRTRLSEQERLIGRVKETGAPLGGEHESEDPDYANDPEGEVIPLDAHIRLANPRTPATEDDRILRRGFSYSRGFDGGGQLDQGLAFVSYQRTMEQFLAIQARLDGEPLEEYIRPEGGGFFFALPGTRDGSTFLGEALLA